MLRGAHLLFIASALYTWGGASGPRIKDTHDARNHDPMAIAVQRSKPYACASGGHSPAAGFLSRLGLVYVAALALDRQAAQLRVPPPRRLYKSPSDDPRESHEIESGRSLLDPLKRIRKPGCDILLECIR